MSQKQTIIDNLETHLRSLPEINRVFQSRQTTLSVRPQESPIVEIIDEGVGTIIVEDETDIRWLSEITLRIHAHKQRAISPGVHMYQAMESITTSLAKDPVLGA